LGGHEGGATQPNDIVCDGRRSIPYFANPETPTLNPKYYQGGPVNDSPDTQYLKPKTLNPKP